MFDHGGVFHPQWMKCLHEHHTDFLSPKSKYQGIYSAWGDDGKKVQEQSVCRSF